MTRLAWLAAGASIAHAASVASLSERAPKSLHLFWRSQMTDTGPVTAIDVFNTDMSARYTKNQACTFSGTGDNYTLDTGMFTNSPLTMLVGGYDVGYSGYIDFAGTRYRLNDNPDNHGADCGREWDSSGAIIECLIPLPASLPVQEFPTNDAKLCFPESADDSIHSWDHTPLGEPLNEQYADPNDGAVSMLAKRQGPPPGKGWSGDKKNCKKDGYYKQSDPGTKHAIINGNGKVQLNPTCDHRAYRRHSPDHYDPKKFQRRTQITEGLTCAGTGTCTVGESSASTFTLGASASVGFSAIITGSLTGMFSSAITTTDTKSCTGEAGETICGVDPILYLDVGLQCYDELSDCHIGGHHEEAGPYEYRLVAPRLEKDQIPSQCSNKRCKRHPGYMYDTKKIPYTGGKN